MAYETLKGNVSWCKTKLNSPTSLSTILDLVQEEGENVSLIKISIKGRHRINKGEKIKVFYHKGPEEIIKVSEYHVLDGLGNVLYEGVADY